MVRVLVFAKQPEDILPLPGVDVVTQDPDVVLCWGGDGTFLLAEHTYPGIPKVLVKHSKTCKKCNDMPLEQVLPLLHKELRTTDHAKLHAQVNGDVLPLATNDVVIRNKNQSHALRFSVFVNGTPLAEKQIGDGVVIATPFGSTAYHKSITRTSFNDGFGLAFNNTVEEQQPHHAQDTDEITVLIERGEGVVTIDTLDEQRVLNDGDRVTVRISSDVAKIVSLA